MKLNAVPTIEVADEALVIAGPTFSVRVWVVPVARLTQSDRVPP